MTIDINVIITAVAPTVAIIVAYFLGKRQTKTVADDLKLTVDNTNTKTTDRLEEIHLLVNDRLTVALNKIQTLEDLLKKEKSKDA